MPVRPMLLHRMALVSFRLFCKNLSNLHEFFGQMVYRPPWPKIARTPMKISTRSGYCCLKEGTGRKIDQSLTISSQGEGRGRRDLFFAGSTLLTKYSLDIFQFCKCWVIDNTSFNYTACLNCKKNFSHINQQYLSRIVNLWKVPVTGNCNLFTEKMLIVSFLQPMK